MVAKEAHVVEGVHVIPVDYHNYEGEHGPALKVDNLLDKDTAQDNFEHMKNMMIEHDHDAIRMTK